MKKKRIFLIGIIILWIIIAVGVILSKQWTLSTGTRVLLETVPVDPRDLLRGDYVVLNYKIGTLDLTKINYKKQYYKPGEIIYVKLEPREKYWEAGEIREKKYIEQDGVYIKAKVKSFYEHNLRLDYGINSYFVPEGRGKDIETSMRSGSNNQVSVEVYIDRFGNAVLSKIYINDNEVKFN